MTRWRSWFPWIACVVLALLSHWKVFENDLFWQTRAGEEIVHGLGIQHFDQWSSTALGQPWRNFQWFATVIDYGVSRIAADYAAFPSFRAFLILLILMSIARLIANSVRIPRNTPWLELILLPIAYIVCSGRFEMRPDIYCITCFGGLLVLESSSMSSRAKLIGSYALLLLWSNLHSGTYPIGAFVFAMSVLCGPQSQGRPARERLAGAAVAPLIWFLNPNGWHVIETLVSITIKYNWRLIMNPDHQPLSLALFNPVRAGWLFIFWLIWCGAAMWRGATQKTPHRAYYLLTGAALIGMTCARMRVRPYSLIFLLPFLVGFVEDGLEHFRMSHFKSKINGSALVLCAAAWLIFLPQHLHSAPAWGFGINRTLYPIESAKFLDQVPASRRFFNAYAFGGYLIDRLRSYPVVQDGREYIFQDLFQKTAAISNSPVFFKRFLENQGYETVLVRAPEAQALSLPGNAHTLWYPPATWAQVAFDDASIVYLKRIPAHAAIIRDFEFHVISRAMHPTEVVRLALQKGLEKNLEQELERCLYVQPESTFCLETKADWLRAQGDIPGSNRARLAARRANAQLSDSLSSEESTPNFLSR